MNNIERLARLRDLLWRMEGEVGIEQLGQSQRDVCYAACLLADEQKSLRSEQVRRPPMAAPMVRPTFYRAQRDLVLDGYLEAAGEARSGRYRVVK